MVITGLTRNQLYSVEYRGFESHRFRQTPPKGGFCFLRWSLVLCTCNFVARTHFSWLTLVLRASTPTALLRNLVSTNPTASAKPHRKVGFVFSVTKLKGTWMSAFFVGLHLILQLVGFVFQFCEYLVLSVCLLLVFGQE